MEGHNLPINEGIKEAVMMSWSGFDLELQGMTEFTSNKEIEEDNRDAVKAGVHEI